ncbi:MAG: hypothetical protein DWI67_00410 [Chloroflexi bacterium]|nr:MAG: hypothetical protein DWI67_00410 [Chloroflexota bacterium]
MMRDYYSNTTAEVCTALQPVQCVAGAARSTMLAQYLPVASIVKFSKQLKQPARAFSCFT